MPAEFERILRFWLDRGVDGFRIDVTHGIAKPAGLPDMDPDFVAQLAIPDHDSHMAAGIDLRLDNDGVHEYHRFFRRILDSYPATGWPSARHGFPMRSDLRCTSAPTN